jgi:hypothetical protein
MFPTLNATGITRNARTAHKVQTQLATLLPSVPPPVESHTPSATQELESAQNVIQNLTTIALKLKTLATKNAKSNHFQNATSKPESANHARMEPAVSQLLLVNQLANQTHTTTLNTTATGPNNHQSAWKSKVHK